MYKVVISAGIFFQFLKIFVFTIIRRVKGQEMAKNDKKFCLSYSVSSNRKSYDCDFWYT